jgi:hypothetical protein
MMTTPDFAGLDDISLQAASLDQRLGTSRALAIEELANRALSHIDIYNLNRPSIV